MRSTYSRQGDLQLFRCPRRATDSRRNFLPEEEEGADVAMVTENFWQKRMGGDPNVIGRSITLNGIAHTIVVSFRTFHFLGLVERGSLDDKTVRHSGIHL